MQRLDIPFNIDLLILDDKSISTMRPIKTLDTYVGATKTLAPEGLYSTESFGLVGSKIRSMRFSYIDLKVSIIHPTLCKALIKLRAL